MSDLVLTVKPTKELAEDYAKALTDKELDQAFSTYRDAGETGLGDFFGFRIVEIKDGQPAQYFDLNSLNCTGYWDDTTKAESS